MKKNYKEPFVSVSIINLENGIASQSTELVIKNEEGNVQVEDWTNEDPFEDSIDW